MSDRNPHATQSRQPSQPARSGLAAGRRGLRRLVVARGTREVFPSSSLRQLDVLGLDRGSLLTRPESDPDWDRRAL